MWLFLSTEIMFFAALIGIYIVFRFGARAWPPTHDVHLSEPIGAFNTFVLICSSVTIVLALESARANRSQRTRLWLFVTLAPGRLFLLVKMYEYKAKFEHGIYPCKPRSQIHERADLYFSSAIRQCAEQIKTEATVVAGMEAASDKLKAEYAKRSQIVDELMKTSLVSSSNPDATAADRHKMAEAIMPAVHSRQAAAAKCDHEGLNDKYPCSRCRF